ncbi:hypothetical protein N7486_006515 [Penicillium sp. IBT 16267x]|nr:hypothetical protein N7486_006515 [Penicillium sp. IBT 16267x]
MDSDSRPPNEVAESSPQPGSPLSITDITPAMPSTLGNGTDMSNPVEAVQLKVETDADEGSTITLTPTTPAPVARAHERTHFNEPINLPREDQSLNADQIIQLMYCAPVVRRKYTTNFDKFGYIRTPWRSMLFEMDDNGETRHPMPILKSNVAGAPIKLAGIRRRAQAAKNLQEKKQADALARSTARSNDRAKALELERQPTPKTAKRPQDQSPNIQTGPRAKKPKPSNMGQHASDQLARPVWAHQGCSAETIASAALSTAPTLGAPQPRHHTDPQRSAGTIRSAALSTIPAPHAPQPRTPLSVLQSGPLTLTAVDDSSLGDISSLFDDFIPTPPVRSSRNSPLNESVTAGAQDTVLPYEEIVRPQPNVESSDIGNLINRPEAFVMDPLLVSGRSNLSNWIDVQTRRLNHQLAGADGDGKSPQYQRCVTKVIIQMYQLRMACMKLNDVIRVELTSHAD